jgi:hypothetical protein
MRIERRTRAASKGIRWLPAVAVVVAVVIAAIAAVRILSARSDTDRRGTDAVARAQSYLAALNAGDVDTASALLAGDGSLSEADGNIVEINALVRSLYPYVIDGCRATSSGDEYVNVDCAVGITDPVWVATGVDELTAPFFVYDDGHMVWRPYQGANFSVAHEANADYLRLNHAEEYEAVCWPPAYPPGSINSVEGIALTPECARLFLPLAEDVAEWVRQGRPGL